MKKIIMIMLLSLSCCITQAEFTRAERVQDDAAYALIKKCMESKSIDAVSCRFDLAAEYATTWSAEPQITKREIIKDTPDYQMAKYTMQVGKLVYFITLKEPKTNMITEVVKGAVQVLIGVAIGVLVSL